MADQTSPLPNVPLPTPRADAAGAGPVGPLRAADGRPLKASLARALRAQKLRAFLLTAPLLLFLLVAFVIPIGDMLLRSVDNRIVPETLPRTTDVLAQWDGGAGELPPEPVFEALYVDLQEAADARMHTRLGSRLNYDLPGISSVFRGAPRALRDMDPDEPLREQFIESNRAWGEPLTWQTIRALSGPYTAGYFLSAVDMRPAADGGVEMVPEGQRIYVQLFLRTLVLSLTITALTLILGYPIAYLIASQPLRTANLLLILVLLPFWTSLLVRTSSWKVLLQQQGVVNDLLVWIGIVSDANRLVMMNNWIGTVVAMTHILLPFMILPLFSVMKTIPPTYVRAATSLGANDWTAFWRVYFPQSVPGIGAGAVLVFILAIGYYITPALVGGTDGIFISNRIAFHISTSLNWGLAAALGSILLVAVLVIYWVYDRMVGIDNVKLG
jgi:putative spermidine/putrescine transport system permease protein